jgi:hypothetical protein
MGRPQSGPSRNQCTWARTGCSFYIAETQARDRPMLLTCRHLLCRHQGLETGCRVSAADTQGQEKIMISAEQNQVPESGHCLCQYSGYVLCDLCSTNILGLRRSHGLCTGPHCGLYLTETWGCEPDQPLPCIDHKTSSILYPAGNWGPEEYASFDLKRPGPCQFWPLWTVYQGQITACKLHTPGTLQGLCSL